MRQLTEAILMELNFGGIVRKQKSVKTLWPKFAERVANVAKKGGSKFYEFLPNGVWHFKVNSGTQEGVKYDMYLRFQNLGSMIDKHVPNKKLWKKDGSGVKLNELAAEIFNDVDMEFDCSCPADTYWGMEYIKTQRKAQYGDQENRPPRKRNPRKLGIVCKHGQMLLTTLPFYTVTLARYIKEYYDVVIKDAEEKVIKADKSQTLISKETK